MQLGALIDDFAMSSAQVQITIVNTEVHHFIAGRSRQETGETTDQALAA